MELEGEREAVLGREGNGNTGQQRPEYLLRGLPWLWGEKFKVGRISVSTSVTEKWLWRQGHHFVVSSDSGL